MQHIRIYTWAIILASCLVSVLALSFSTARAQVIEQGDVNVTATVYGVPPSTQAVILQPSNGEVLQTTPLVVQGTCGANLLVRVFNNGDLAGSIACSPSGAFIMNITLIIGSNELTALNYDIQDQPGPISPAVTVTVEPPVVPEDPSSPPVVTEDNTVVIDGSPTPTTEQAESAGEQVPLFEDTFLAPIVKILDAEVLVSSTVKAIVDTTLSAFFVSIVFAPVLWGLFMVWLRLF